MSALPRLDDAERRRRMGVRHGLAGAYRVATVEQAAESVVALHATDSPSVFLSTHARTEALIPEMVRVALEEERTLVRQTCMRTTLFAVPRDLMPAVLGSAAARSAGPLERRLRKALDADPRIEDTDEWVTTTCALLVDVLTEAGPLTSGQLRQRLPALDVRIDVAPGTKWGRPLPASQYVLGWLSANGTLVRAHNDGPWHSARPTYAASADWLGGDAAPLPSDEGYAEVTRQWLRRFGPGTLDDLVWWLGSTKTAARHALEHIGAVEVLLDGGQRAYVHADDLAPTPPVDEWAALLPTLDPSTMGWRERGFYLDPSMRRLVFDSVGNASNTAWWNGQIVGTWGQAEDCTVKVVPFSALGPRALAALDAEAVRLSEFLAGDRVPITYNARHLAGEPLP